jgi:hypothetical protein
MARDGFFGFPRSPAEAADNIAAHFEGSWGERLVMTVAVSAAVLVVASIAVLMGMVGP